jgi:hypothetical protein
MFFMIRAIAPTFKGPAGSTNTIRTSAKACSNIKPMSDDFLKLDEQFIYS